jgi:hypothetical protein
MLDQDPTEVYLSENIRIHSLRRENIAYSGNSKEIECTSIRKILIQKLSNLFIGSLRYCRDLAKHRTHYFSLLRLRKSKNCSAIVIGNGPSQGYLTKKCLQNFRDDGGSIYSVNYWNKNQSLASIAPDYLVISDPGTLANPAEMSLSRERYLDNEALLSYLHKNPYIAVFCPFARVDYIISLIGEKRVFGFCDVEIRWISSNINPLFPRGYLSMTLLKALSLSIFLGHKKIFVIGMDNTYPRNLYCDSENHIINHEIHAGVPDYISDFSSMFPTIASYMQEMLFLFGDITRCFSNKPVINLDPYSLTDAFKKDSSLLKDKDEDTLYE